MKYFLLHLGCQMNQSDAERVRSVLESLGYESTDTEEEAELLGIMACSVRQKAIDRVYARIHKWNSWKKNRAIITFVSGCILPADKEVFLKLFDILFSIEELPKLSEILRQYGVPTKFSQSFSPQQSNNSHAYWNIKPQYTSHFEAYVSIQNGCDKFCTFCAVPYTRGREVSRPSQDILQEIELLVEQDYKSITILGQNVNSYGFDKRSEEIRFAELLRRIGEIGKKSQKSFWVYFTSPHPHDMHREVLEVVAEYPVLANNIHLPIQSGDDKILIKMNRNYRIETYEKIVTDIHNLLPKATLFTDIIVGFTGESDDQFNHTLEAIRRYRYHMAYIAQYSPRPGAASYRWEDDIPHDVKSYRYHKATEVLREVAIVENKKYLESTQKVLVYKKARKDGYLEGKTEGRIPVHFASTDESLIGNFVDVQITQANTFSLAGEYNG